MYFVKQQHVPLTHDNIKTMVCIASMSSACFEIRSQSEAFAASCSTVLGAAVL